MPLLAKMVRTLTSGETAEGPGANLVVTPPPQLLVKLEPQYGAGGLKAAPTALNIFMQTLPSQQLDLN